MNLDTEKTIYLGINRSNAEVTVLVPRHLEGIRIVELYLDDPGPDSTDAAQFKLLETEMEATTYQV
jgi:hypothetical protein